MNENMKNWVIYERPLDYPEHYVLRLWLIVNGRLILTPLKKFAKSLEDIRKEVPPGLYCFPREMDDSPHLLETWC